MVMEEGHLPVGQPLRTWASSLRMSVRRSGQMLPESCGWRVRPFFPARTPGSGEAWNRLSATRRCL
jgi:hypothetical protein